MLFNVITFVYIALNVSDTHKHIVHYNEKPEIVEIRVLW